MLGVALWTLSACYSYVTVPPGGAKVGERVRVRVSGAEAERLEPLLGGTARNFEGELLEQGDTNIALRVALPMQLESGVHGEQAQQRIVISRADLQDIELRRLDKLRTSLLLGGGVAVVATVATIRGTTLLGSRGSGSSPNESRSPRTTPILKGRIVLP
jgi:hypothetical protein